LGFAAAGRKGKSSHAIAIDEAFVQFSIVCFYFQKEESERQKKCLNKKKNTDTKNKKKKASRTFPRSAVSTTQTPLLPTLLKKPTTLTIKDLCMQSFDRTNAT
jgi:hypothetical protein